MVSRRLQVAFILSGQPFGWRCSACGRMFVPFGSPATPEEQRLMEREFRQHLCSYVTNVLTIEEIAEQDRSKVPSVSSLKVR
ncbi:MAG TPA: hypothetical protein VFU86_00040 [Terriglobales bacterium]|nr:hypothetical protein [Terriglobales bacterium]